MSLIQLDAEVLTRFVQLVALLSQRSLILTEQEMADVWKGLQLPESLVEQVTSRCSLEVKWAIGDVILRHFQRKLWARNDSVTRPFDLFPLSRQPTRRSIETVRLCLQRVHRFHFTQSDLLTVKDSIHTMSPGVVNCLVDECAIHVRWLIEGHLRDNRHRPSDKLFNWPLAIENGVSRVVESILHDWTRSQAIADAQISSDRETDDGTQERLAVVRVFRLDRTEVHSLASPVIEDAQACLEVVDRSDSRSPFSQAQELHNSTRFSGPLDSNQPLKRRRTIPVDHHHLDGEDSAILARSKSLPHPLKSCPPSWRPTDPIEPIDTTHPGNEDPTLYQITSYKWNSHGTQGNTPHARGPKAAKSANSDPKESKSQGSCLLRSLPKLKKSKSSFLPKINQLYNSLKRRTSLDSLLSSARKELLPSPPLPIAPTTPNNPPLPEQSAARYTFTTANGAKMQGRPTVYASLGEVNTLSMIPKPRPSLSPLPARPTGYRKPGMVPASHSGTLQPYTGTSPQTCLRLTPADPAMFKLSYHTNLRVVPYWQKSQEVREEHEFQGILPIIPEDFKLGFGPVVSLEAVCRSSRRIFRRRGMEWVQW